MKKQYIIPEINVEEAMCLSLCSASIDVSSTEDADGDYPEGGDVKDDFLGFGLKGYDW